MRRMVIGTLVAAGLIFVDTASCLAAAASGAVISQATAEMNNPMTPAAQQCHCAKKDSHGGCVKKICVDVKGKGKDKELFPILPRQKGAQPRPK